MIATSGMKLLELYPSKNPNGSLAKMLRGLLTSKTAWCSDRSTMTWKARVSKCKVLLFQLAVSVRGIKGKEFGLLATPNTMDHLPPRSKEGTLKLMRGHRKGRTKPCNLREQVDPQTMAMYPTPNATNINTPQSDRVELTKSGGFILRKKKQATHDIRSEATRCDGVSGTLFGGKLVEFCRDVNGLSTKLDKDRANRIKSLGNSIVPQIAREIGKAIIEAKNIEHQQLWMLAKIVLFILQTKGKTNRNSNSRVQITLSTDVALKFLEDNPHLINKYDKPFMVRTKLPNKFEFINYLKKHNNKKNWFKTLLFQKLKLNIGLEKINALLTQA